MQNLRNSFTTLVSTIDPGYLALKRSSKTFIAILLSLVIFWQTPGMAMFAAISSMLISRSQAGFTIAERRFTMIATSIVLILLSVPVSLASQNDWLAIAYVFLASFITFFLIGNRTVPDFPAVSVLALSVVEMAFSHTLESGLKFSGLFLLTTALVYILHFVIWPTRPRKRLKVQIDVIIANLVNYNQAIHATYQNEEAGMKNTQERSDNLRRSIGDFRRLWQLFNVKNNHDKSIESRYLDIYTGLGKIHEFLLLMWQFRVSAWESSLYRNLIIDNVALNRIIDYLIHRHSPSIIKPSDVKLNRVKTEIDGIAREFLDKFKTEYTEETHRDWVAVMNAVKALEALTEDLQRMDLNEDFTGADFSLSKKINAISAKLLDAAKKLKTWNPAYRLGIRSAVIIGSTATFVSFFKPDYGYWLILFAVLLIRPNLGISIRAGKERFLGTLAGSLLALAFVSVVPSNHPIYFICLFVSVFLMIWFINLNKMIPMVTALTFMIVCLFYMLYPENSNLVWLRISYTFSIVLLVIFVSFLLWPEKARKKFAGALANAIEVEKAFFESIIRAVLSGRRNVLTLDEKQKIRDHIQQLNEVIEATKSEVLQERVIVHGLNIRSYIMRLLNTLQALDSSSQMCMPDQAFLEMQSDLTHFADEISKAFAVLITALRERKSTEDFPDLNKEFNHLRMHFREIKYREGDRSSNITQYWKNSSFIWNLKPLILELEGIKKEIELKIAEA